MKHFEENLHEGEDLIILHSSLLQSVKPLASNLFLHATSDEADVPKYRAKLARSAYNVIAVCEAIIARVPEEESRDALEYIRYCLGPLDHEDFDEHVRKILLSIFE